MQIHTEVDVSFVFVDKNKNNEEATTANQQNNINKIKMRIRQSDNICTLELRTFKHVEYIGRFQL